MYTSSHGKTEWCFLKSLKYDQDLKLIQSIDLPRTIKEGWGMARDWNRPAILYISDGSNIIYEVDLSQGFTVVKSHPFHYNNKRLDHINELEFINGDIFANIYMTNTIVQLDLQTDSVKKVFDFGFLELKANEAAGYVFHRYLNEGECLNGIAYNRGTKTLLLTGKHWPVMFDVAWDDPMFK